MAAALGDVGSRGGALGGDVDGGGARGARAVGGAGGTDGGREEGRRREEGNIWGGLLSRVKPPPGTKGPFVPGGGFTRDKRPPPYISFLLRPSPNTWFLICARPAPPTARAEHRRHRRRRRPEPRPHAAAQSHRRRRNALATIPCSPSTRRYRPSQPTPRTQR